MNEIWTQKQVQAAKNRHHWLPWYVIVWRIIWWVPTWSTLAVFCTFIWIYTFSSHRALDAWDNET